MVAVEDVVVVGEVGDVQVVAAVVVVVADGHAHVGLRPPVGVERRARGVADVGEPAAAEVAVDVVRPRVVGDEQIEPAVVVHVEPGDAEAEARLALGHAGGLGDVGERAVAVVVEQVIGRAGQAERPAHDRLAAIGAEGGAGGERRARRRPARLALWPAAAPRPTVAAPAAVVPSAGGAGGRRRGSKAT